MLRSVLSLCLLAGSAMALPKPQSTMPIGTCYAKVNGDPPAPGNYWLVTMDILDENYEILGSADSARDVRVNANTTASLRLANDDYLNYQNMGNEAGVKLPSPEVGGPEFETVVESELLFRGPGGESWYYSQCGWDGHSNERTCQFDCSMFRSDDW